MASTLLRYLDCGDFSCGFLRVACTTPGCREEVLVPFSCKRAVCPSCAQRRSLDFAEFVNQEVLEQVPYRHVVFTVPKVLRASTCVTVDDAGIRWMEAGRSVQAAWSEVSATDLRDDALDGSTCLDIRTSNGALTVRIVPPRLLAEVLDAPPIHDAERLATLVRPA